MKATATDRARRRPEGAKKRQQADQAAAAIQRRIRLRHKTEQNDRAKAITLAHCSNDPIQWINDWVWTYDPRASSPIPKWRPFVLWDVQEELVEWAMTRLRRQESGGVKKSRDMGFTWTFAALATWIWLFEDAASVTFGSRKEDLVDNLGDLDSIFPKIREIIRRLPVWMRPAGFDPAEHDNEMRIINPETGATITGEVGDNMGRGGRSTLYVADEFAFVQHAGQVRGAVGGNADCVIYGSTSGGEGTEFRQMEVGGDIPFFRMHWRNHPHRDDDWADKKRREIGEVQFAREYEMDDAAAIEGLAIPSRWVQAAVELELPTDGLEAAGLDVADSGDDENVYIHRKGPVVQRLETWRGENTTKTARRAMRYAGQDGCEIIRYDSVGVGAGVRGEFEEEGEGIQPVAVDGGKQPTKTTYSDDPRHTARERFTNLVTECWWALRVRFQKTFERMEGIKSHPLDECISIPNNATLIAQLSSRKLEEREAGKVKVESKKKMKKRGVDSPDRADGLAYAFADSVKESTVQITKSAPVVR